MSSAPNFLGLTKELTSVSLTNLGGLMCLEKSSCWERLGMGGYVCVDACHRFSLSLAQEKQIKKKNPNSQLPPEQEKS